MVAADAADESQLRDAVTTATRSFGRLNGVIHAAGVQQLSALAAIDVAAGEEQFKAKGIALPPLNPGNGVPRRHQGCLRQCQLRKDV